MAGRGILLVGQGGGDSGDHQAGEAEGKRKQLELPGARVASFRARSPRVLSSHAGAEPHTWTAKQCGPLKKTCFWLGIAQGHLTAIPPLSAGRKHALQAHTEA